MDSAVFLELLQRHRAIAVIRTDELNQGLHLAQAAAAGGLRLIEITWNSRYPSQLITQLREQLPHCHIGAGTMLAISDLEQAIAAGAEFCFAPYTHLPMVQWAREHHLPLVPGALTPSEIVTAWQAGACAVKVFPISAVGGASYIRSLQGPLGAIPLVPTGGVTLANAPALLQAGATAVGLSTGLFANTAIAQADWDSITHTCQQLVEVCQAITPLSPPVL
ncbi:MAG TPA: bifunctional 4-hydroxy-2-oxoglutarate aldolase/2-dehydro-3-deoxy-phosphogluconate aldolase [Leptolyngbyaceae cyanobacterium M65_K2018_010]|nr:bifunctional 4-hydroxy-2-oxoglutarate aldolase/2-dehydro-3-deoxy-phosphogluconate aldolase [Leptolyngbyaceae cyanobacterium M65_K2018_010]